MKITRLFFIDSFKLGTEFSSFADAVSFAQDNYIADGDICIYESYDDEGEGATRIAFRGLVKNLPTEIEQYIMDASIANLGNRRNGY